MLCLSLRNAALAASWQDSEVSQFTSSCVSVCVLNDDPQLHKCLSLHQMVGSCPTTRNNNDTYDNLDFHNKYWQYYNNNVDHNLVENTAYFLIYFYLDAHPKKYTCFLFVSERDYTRLINALWLCVLIRIWTQPSSNSLRPWFMSSERGKKSKQYSSLRTTIPELCGMCTPTASDWNLLLLNYCSTQPVVAYCHSESHSSADANIGSVEEREKCCCLRPSECSVKAHLYKESVNTFLFLHTLKHTNIPGRCSFKYSKSVHVTYLKTEQLF